MALVMSMVGGRWQRRIIHVRDILTLRIPSGAFIAVTGKGWSNGRGHDYAAEMSCVASFLAILLVLLYSFHTRLSFMKG